MDFWRAYHVLIRRKWIIFAAVFLTMTVATAGIILYGRQYDASTVFGPTDQAMRHAVNSGNEGQTPVLTNETRMEEARRIAWGASNPNTVNLAIFYLAGAGVLRQSLALEGLENVNGPDYDAVSRAVNDRIDELDLQDRPGRSSPLVVQTWDPETADKESALYAIYQRSGIPLALWADFVYLDLKMDHDNVSRESLRPERIADTVATLAKKVTPEIGSPRDVVLNVRHRDPRMAEVLANAITAVYKQQYDSDNLQGSLKQLLFFRNRQAQTSRQYVAARDALTRWRNQHREVFREDQIAAAAQRERAAREELAQVNANLKNLDAQIAAKKARLAATPRMLERIEKVQSPEVQELRNKIAGLEASLAQRRGAVTDSHPDIVRIKRDLEPLNRRLREVENNLLTNKTVSENTEWVELDREVARLEQSRSGLATQVATANQALAEAAARMASVPTASVEAQSVQNAFAAAGEALSESNRKLRLAEEDFRRVDDTGALRVSFWAGLPPGTPERPVSPAREGGTRRNMAMLAAAFVLSLLASAGIVLGLDFLDTSIKTPYDAEHMLNEPVNGIVPRLDGPARAALPMVTHNLPASPHAESYRFLGTDILLSANGDNPFKSIMVATAKPGQGGTSTICNLAITLAQAGQSVVLVDADLRRPSLHRIFNLENESGLTTVLENGRLPSDVLQRTEVENLYVMTGGPKTSNAWKLLRSDRMKDVIVDLSRDFDFVLFDTPSAVVFADAATLATMLDGVLLVVRAHEAPSGSELQVKGLLNKTRARIVGVVLNDVPAEQVDSARYFNHYYAPGAGHREVAASAGGARTALPTGRSDEEI